MRHRTHDHLFAAAGVTAALSLIGTGVTVLKGSVLEFSAWPVVGHDQPRRTALPVAPVVLAPNGGTSSRLAAIANNSGGTIFPGVAAATGAQAPIGSLDFSLPAPVIVPRNGGVAATPGTSANGNGGTQADSGDAQATIRIQLQGGAGSLGAGSSKADGIHDPVGGNVPAATTGDPRTVSDKDGDGVPDTWSTDTGTPSTATQVVSDQGARGRDGSAAFTAETPGTDPSEGKPAPTDTTPVEPTPTPTPTPTEPDPVPTEPAPTDPAPTDPTPAPAPADPAPPADPVPAPEPAPAAPADPAPASAPVPADPAPPAAEPTNTASSTATSTATTTSTSTASATAAPADAAPAGGAAAGIPSSAQ
jgi:hypothetical protein